ncbi:MAG: VWA domain-containing protein [Candidatus Tectomicrobia bacterium]|uniref:VWA domain-containing protein n=1 Tax=Tectimicrobiota bacterium TaxID=2528274 RepID=A0A932FVH2_UNCTE|nr:VWA domain-containing protein [Candidatus Tectomicrobia bacterium]
MTPGSRWLNSVRFFHLLRVLPLGLLLVAPWPSSVLPEEEPKLQVSFGFPPDGSYFGQPKGLATVAGRILPPADPAPTYDVILVLDTSGSTAWPAGGDVDGDGITGTPFNISPSRRYVYPINSDPDDSILCAEVLGAQRLLQLFDPSVTRVGLVTFSGDTTPDAKRPVPETPDARLEHPLTADYQKLEPVLREIYLREPEGGTNMAEGVQVALAALAPPASRPQARKVMILLTDGMPTFPAGDLTKTDPQDREATLQAARKAAQAGITLHTLAIGPEALSDSSTVSEMARLSGGTFTPIQRPIEVINLLPRIQLAGVSSLTVENTTLGQPAAQIFLGPDGFFLASLPVTLGPNRIRATAASHRGERGEALLTLHYVEDGSSPELGVDLNQGTAAGMKSALERQRPALLDPEIARLLELKARTRERTPPKERLELELEKQ